MSITSHIPVLHADRETVALVENDPLLVRRPHEQTHVHPVWEVVPLLSPTPWPRLCQGGARRRRRSTARLVRGERLYQPSHRNWLRGMKRGGGRCLARQVRQPDLRRGHMRRIDLGRVLRRTAGQWACGRCQGPGTRPGRVCLWPGPRRSGCRSGPGSGAPLSCGAGSAAWRRSWCDQVLQRIGVVRGLPLAGTATTGPPPSSGSGRACARSMSIAGFLEQRRPLGGTTPLRPGTRPIRPCPHHPPACLGECQEICRRVQPPSRQRE
jgi:hypothetical protein